MTELPPPARADPHARWKFLRDVFVFQIKLVLGNLQNFLLLPVSLGAAVLDLFARSDREDGYFYRVLDWGRQTDEAINIYSAIGGYHSTGGDDENALKNKYSVDAVLAKIESVIVREYEKGGTAASVKGAVDRAIDGMQEKTGPTAERMAEKMKDKVKEAADRFTDATKKP